MTSVGVGPRTIATASVSLRTDKRLWVGRQNWGKMVLDNLGSSLRGTMDTLRGKSRLDEEDVQEIVKEIQRSLLQADVEVDLVMDLSSNIEERALNEEPPGGTSARDHILKIVYEEMVEVVGESTELPLEPQTVMLSGLQGSGKTTTAAKIAWWFSKKGQIGRAHV